MSWTTENVIARLDKPAVERLPKPLYEPTNYIRRIALAVESMRRHMTDEGWQIMAGLEAAGYGLCGHNINHNETDVGMILYRNRPGTIVIQDKREWDGKTAGAGFDERERFTNYKCLRERHEVFKVTVLKDAQNNPPYHRESADEIGCHAWIVYYHPKIVAHVAPFVRPEHLIRTYHSLDAMSLPDWVPGRERRNVVISGAVSGAYPLRKRLQGSGFDQLPHPGYRRDGCYTPNYLKALGQYKVSICTASRYGYALRKIIESTAVGCRVVTDLPADDVLPYIDDNLIRVHNDATPEDVRAVAYEAAKNWDDHFQTMMACRAAVHYDYQRVGYDLSNAIETMRVHYNPY